MSAILTPRIGRRQVIGGMAAAVSSGLLLPSGTAWASGRVLTPRQTKGPFYPVHWAGDIDNDLVRVTGGDAESLGRVSHIMGRVTDTQGTPIAGAIVEIWQCDQNGRYLHPGDWQRRKRDEGFQGRGRTRTSGDGGYRFRTIRPVPYPGRTPHIHFAIEAPDGRRLVTQMYVAGEPGNERDGLLQRIRDPRQRASVIVALEPADRIEAGALGGTFDIVLAA